MTELEKSEKFVLRLNTFDGALGRLTGEVSDVRIAHKEILKRLEMIELKIDKPRDEMSSETDLSIHPTKIRISFRNYSGWMIFFSILILAITSVVWMILKH